MSNYQTYTLIDVLIAAVIITLMAEVKLINDKNKMAI